ncbi:preprotein translocase subunit SecE [Microbacterium indicum]|uniref:preprotein translocase subunit SecE n=1 Tax=Microbacterium indicum TaxID=358100 RepID=UPI00048AE323|nr:preprotein translocase subunit SecE [Microbacterium indicum]
MSQDAVGGFAARGASAGKKPNFFMRIVIFFRQVISELRKVVTPTRKELLTFTGVVLGFVIVMMALILGLDTVFSWVVNVVFGVPS